MQILSYLQHGDPGLLMCGIHGRILGTQNCADVQERIDNEAENPDQPGCDRQLNQSQTAARSRVNSHMSELRKTVIDNWYSARLVVAPDPQGLYVGFVVGPRPKYWYPNVNTALYVFGIEAVETSVTVHVIVPLTMIPPVVSWVQDGAVFCSRQ